MRFNLKSEWLWLNIECDSYSSADKEKEKKIMLSSLF